MRIVIAAVMALLLAGCAKYVETDISVFHELSSPLAGGTYALIPSQEQEGSLEYLSYAQMVKGELNRHGMVEKTPIGAEYAVYLSYGETGVLAPIMPAVIRSLFREFPGQSGSFRKVREPLETTPR